jgi:hypothetical protein
MHHDADELSCDFCNLLALFGKLHASTYKASTTETVESSPATTERRMANYQGERRTSTRKTKTTAYTKLNFSQVKRNTFASK